MPEEKGKKANESYVNGFNEGKDKETQGNTPGQNEAKKRAEIKECVGNLVVLNKIQGALLTRLKTELEEINSI